MLFSRNVTYIYVMITNFFQFVDIFLIFQNTIFHRVQILFLFLIDKIFIDN